MEIKLKKDAPIGVFDSGVGGISVLRELVHIMPNENYLYFGDSLHAPYGTKTLEEVRKLTIANIEKLLNDGAKGIVVACNTATSAAVAILRKMYPSVPLVGIEPAIKPAVLQKPGSRIVVMATPMTLKQEKFQKLMKQYEKDAQIISLPCPGLMEFVERGDLDGDDLKKYLTELFWSVQEEKIDSIVLGCTHYPFAKKAIEQIVEHVGETGEIPAPIGDIVDGGNGTAREMQRRLMEAGLCTDATQKGTVQFLNSRDTKEEKALCEFLLNR